MSVTPFITSTNSVHNGVFIYMITVEDSLPTPLQFIFTLEEMRENLEIRKQEHGLLLQDGLDISYLLVASFWPLLGLLPLIIFGVNCP
jgi:hypothetical protein